jgi:hypothetical protein
VYCGGGKAVKQMKFANGKSCTNVILSTVVALTENLINLTSYYYYLLILGQNHFILQLFLFIIH